MNAAAGLAIGLAGGLHCLVMCGPLVGVVAPVFGRRIGASAWYQVGRVGTYAGIGLVAGATGAAAGAAGFGRGLSVVAGALLLVRAVVPASRPSSPVSAWWTRQLSTGLGAIGRARTRHPVAAAVAAGAVNGALPCGLVYAAALAAGATGSAADGARVMLAFGAGTAPVLLGVWTGLSRLPESIRHRLRVLTPATLGIVGVLLVMRGLQVATHHTH